MKHAAKPFIPPSIVPSLLVGSLVLAGTLSGVFIGTKLGGSDSRNRGSTAPGGRFVPGEGEADWFMLLRLPEVYTASDSASIVEKRVNEWLSTLKKAGFKPMLFSDVLRAVRNRETLPEKTVVLMVQPGFKKTMDVLGPVFERFNTPVLWVTDSRPIKKGDRRYLGKFEGVEMKASGLFDLGYYTDAPEKFTLDPAYRNRTFKGEVISLVTGQEEGRIAINFEDKIQKINRINVNLRWNGQQLIQRLATEIPITERSRLTVMNMAGRHWGVFASPLLPQAPVRFDLSAGGGSRSAAIRWDGTLGTQDMQVEIEAQSISGELWVHMRHDRVTDDGVMVGFLPDSIVVQQLDKGQLARIGQVPYPKTVASSASLNAKITLIDYRLELTLPGMEPKAMELPLAAVSKNCTLGLTVSGKISGVAQAKGVILYATPLAKKH